MRRYFFRLTFLAVAALGTSVALGNDQQIAQTIVQKLSAEKKAGNLKGFNIELNVEEGTVWLSGRVSSEEQRARALDIARRIEGVKQVVNDLSVEQPPVATGSIMNKFSSAVRQAVGRGESTPAQPVAREIGTGVTPAPAQLENVGVPPAPIPVPFPAQPLPAQQFPAQQFPAQQFPAQQLPVQQFPAQQFPQQFPAQQMQPHPYLAAMPAPQAIPYVYGRSTNQVPLAYAPARTIAYNGGPGGGPIGVEGAVGGGGPMPIQIPGTSVGMAAARYDHPNMPGYAWPSYASHPNYAAVTYPKQYSPTAWPYIGPFYPYPQVPLGWRRVCLEWDDGWWFLDFTARRH